MEKFEQLKMLEYLYNSLNNSRFCKTNLSRIVEWHADAGKNIIPLTVLRKLFAQIGKEYENRNGGYTRIYHLPPRRGDGVEMALIQLV